jgi:hypothetical protein
VTHEGDHRSGGEPAGEAAAVSSAWKIWTSVIAFALVLWFFFAWLALDRHILDAAGESVGTAFALGLLVSVIGALRASSRS